MHICSVSHDYQGAIRTRYDVIILWISYIIIYYYYIVTISLHIIRILNNYNNEIKTCIIYWVNNNIIIMFLCINIYSYKLKYLYVICKYIVKVCYNIYKL